MPFALVGTLVAAACQSEHAPPPRERPANGLAFPDAPGGGETEAADSLVLRVQVALDRAGFSPGVIDGRENALYRLALGGFQEARGLSPSGTLDPQTQAQLLGGSASAATRRVVIPDEFARGPIAPDQPSADRIVVDKSQGTLRAYDKQGKLMAQFPVTTGSRHDPLPLGTWKIRGESRNPQFHYNPDLFWDASSKDEKTLLPPGPNGPVGVVWIDLSKEHYGIHGTPEPQTIGKTQSHGCVRLTNWDAARLAQMVDTGTTVVFQA